MSRTLFLSLLAAGLLAGCSGGNHVPAGNRYVQTNLVANKPQYNPQILEPDLQNAWGISIRPAGAGGHFWVTAQGTGKSLEYVGDVHDASGFVPLYTDDLTVVSIPNHGGVQGTPTGTVFNTGTSFTITQGHANGPITAPAKFFFATDAGVLTAWTERAKAGGGFDRPTDSVIVYDQSAAGSAFFGVAMSQAADRLYLADFGNNPRIVTLDGAFHEVAAPFANPFPGYGPFNVHTIGDRVFVAYARIEQVGEEVHAAGAGKLVEYDAAGNQIAIWDDRNLLNAPWGIAKAPDMGFGIYSGKLLVGNFGNGTITVFDPTTRKAIDYLRDDKGIALQIPGLWEILFGNGVRLGDANALYFAAGPGEVDGIFGRITAR